MMIDGPLITPKNQQNSQNDINFEHKTSRPDDGSTQTLTVRMSIDMGLERHQPGLEARRFPIIFRRTRWPSDCLALDTSKNPAWLLSLM
jgi:hypothetical protein